MVTDDGISFTSVIQSTSPTSGAVTLDGGLGLLGNIYTAGSIVVSSTGAITVAKGTTQERPVAADAGMIRFNTSYSGFEGYNGIQWTPIGGFNSIVVGQSQSPYTAKIYEFLFVDTSAGAVTVTLPVSANIGDVIRFIDVSGTFEFNNLTVQPNGLKIFGLTDNLVINNNDASLALVYTGATYGWKLLEL
jgi:hypothetical protein